MSKHTTINWRVTKKGSTCNIWNLRHFIILSASTLFYFIQIFGLQQPVSARGIGYHNLKENPKTHAQRMREITQFSSYDDDSIGLRELIGDVKRNAASIKAVMDKKKTASTQRPNSQMDPDQPQNVDILALLSDIGKDLLNLQDSINYCISICEESQAKHEGLGPLPGHYAADVSSFTTSTAQTLNALTERTAKLQLIAWRNSDKQLQSLAASLRRETQIVQEIVDLCANMSKEKEFSDTAKYNTVYGLK